MTLSSVLLFLYLQVDPFPGLGQPNIDTERTAVSFRFENDVFRDTDRFYTNGFSISWAKLGRPEGFMDRLWGCIGVYDWFDGMQSHVTEFGQIIVTPEDKSREIPDPSDRPYVGILYLAKSMQFETASKIDVIKGIIGVMGPWALGEEAQNGVHGLFGFEEAQGWDYQLENELVVNVVYEHRRKFRFRPNARSWSSECIAIGGGMLGNILTQVQGGMQFRAGYRLPNDFGTSLIRGAGNIPPTCQCWSAVSDRKFRVGWHVFAGGNANLVARNGTLDGNLFHDGPSVDKEHFFGGLEFGAALVFRRFQIAYSYVMWGKEFEGQPNDSEFGAFVVSFGI